MSTNDIKNMKDTVEQSIRKSSNVFLIGHNSPDFDSIGSCLGLSEIATAYKKDSFIIIYNFYNFSHFCNFCYQ